MPQNATGNDSSNGGAISTNRPTPPTEPQNALHSEECSTGLGDSEADGEENDDPETFASGWRVAVNMVKGVWRMERFSGQTREYTEYRPLHTIRGGKGRIDYAKRNSEQQKAAKAAARIRRG
jgi:hypothetical protein